MSPDPRLTPGRFGWPELVTSDLDAAIRFYASLLGWSAREAPMDGGRYVLFSLGGRDTAAGYELSETMRAQGTAPHWGDYVMVADADAAAARVKTAGGTVIAGPFDVADLGRMVAAADPSGATFQLWEARRFPGIGVANEPGALGWKQLNVRDPEPAKRFYADVFGWSAQEVPAANGAPYTMWSLPDGPVAGMLPMPPDVPPEARAHWLTYFVVADVDAAHAQALAQGARSFVAPRVVHGGGTIAVIADPQGAKVGLMSPSA